MSFPSRFEVSSFEVPGRRSTMGRISRMVALACALTTVSSGLVASQAVAQERKALSDSERNQAKEHYDKATKLFNIQRYNDAIEEYQNVYLITSDANMLVNIAQAHRLNEELTKAAQVYRRYLSVAPADSQGRPLAERKLAEVEKLIEDRKKSGTVAPPGPAPIAPDPAITAPPAPAPFAPPPVVQPPLGTPAPPPSNTVAATLSQPGVPPDGGASSSKVPLAAYVLVIGGVVLTGAAIGLGLAAKSKSDEAESLPKKGRAWDPSIEQSGKMFNTLTIVSGVAAGAALIAGAVVFFSSRSSTSTAKAPGAQTAFSPWILPGGGGAGARIAF